MKVGRRILIAAVMMAVIITGNSMQTNAIGKFDPAFYAAKYPDVWAAFGADQEALYNHYITYGQEEGRVPYLGAASGESVYKITNDTVTNTNVVTTGKFNAVFYATKYPDVKAVFGTNARALYNHYLTYGQKEKRIPYPGAAPGQAVTGIATAEEMAAQTAENPVTYTIKYVETNSKKHTWDWRYQSGTNTWLKDGGHRELYYLKMSIQDGDVIVIDTDTDASAGDRSGLNLEVPVTLSNVTFIGSGGGVITAKSIKDVYVLQSATGVVNGDVTNAYVYDNGIANFNNNVSNLYIKEINSDKQTIAVAGRVDYVEWSNKYHIIKTLYNFSKGSFRQEKGVPKI